MYRESGCKCKLQLQPKNYKIRLNTHVFLQMQILISLLPFQDLRDHLKFQKVDEDVHGEIKLPSKFPGIFDVKKLSFFKIPNWLII